MSDKEHAYSNGEVSIIWKPGLCCHSTKCWRGLPEVFKPGARPWITPQGMDTRRIIDQVAQCPSGALSIRQDAGMERHTSTASVFAVEVERDGPLVLKGPVEITHEDGRVERMEDGCVLCRCGLSKIKPFCDHSHARKGSLD